MTKLWILAALFFVSPVHAQDNRSGLPEAREVTVAPFDDGLSQIVSCTKVNEFARLLPSGRVAKRRDLRGNFVGCAAQNVPYVTYRLRGETKMYVFTGKCVVQNRSSVCTPLIQVPGFRDSGGAQFQLEIATGLTRPLWLTVKPALSIEIDENISPVSSDSTVAFDSEGKVSVTLNRVGLDYVITVVSAGKAIGSAAVFLPAGKSSYRLSWIGGCLVAAPAAPPGEISPLRRSQ